MPSKKNKRIIEYRRYGLSNEFPVLLLTGKKWKISDVPSDSLHFHNCLEIGICHAGSGILRFYNGQDIPFKEGDLTCIPKNIPHSTCSSPDTKSQWSYFFLEPRLLFHGLETYTPISATPYTDASWYRIPSERAGRLSMLAQASLEELSLDPPQHALGRGYLYLLYLEILRYWKNLQEETQEAGKGALPPSLQTFKSSPPILSKDEQAPRTSIVRGRAPGAETDFLTILPALDYIEENYMNKFPIEDLAELCHLSPTHFRRLFQSVMHSSPLTYLNTIRIGSACNLLRNTNQSILSISEMSGFATLSNFNRHFSRFMRLSPREYRKQILQDKTASGMPSIVEYPGWMEP